MKRFNKIPFVLIFALFAFSFTEIPESEQYKTVEWNESSAIQWKTMKEAIELDNSDKKYFIYVYTDWCSWCKRMKNTTFQDDKVIKLLNEDFIPVSFNGESKQSIKFRGQEFKYIQNGPRGGHELAMALLNNQPSYPSLVFLDEEMNMIQPLPGYKSAEDLSLILTFLAEKIYEKMSFEDYYNQQTQAG
ncbi:MAG: thioredoxin family protein [Bacteroidota bacterium]